MMAGSSMAQFFPSCDIDTALARKLPVQAALTRDISNNIPAAASIQKYTPVPGNQGQTGTCTAWSSTYCAMTMAWAMKNGTTNRGKITQNAYLPCYTYVNILTQSTTNCAAGTDIARACDWLKNTGAVKLSNYPQNPACINTSAVPSSWKSLASQHRLPGYTKLFFDYNNLQSKVTSTKRAIANGHPVLMAINCANSLCNSQGVRSDGLWQPVGNENPRIQYGGHALVVVAYDDSKFGCGAFLIQNSWGENWGYKGYFWITYYHYACWVYYAFEMNLERAAGMTVDQDCNHLNFGTSKNERDYPADVNPRPNNNRPDNNRPDNNKPNNGYTQVDNDFLKYIADQYGLDYNDYLRNKDKYNRPNNNNPRPNDNPKPPKPDNNRPNPPSYNDYNDYNGGYDDDNNDYNGGNDWGSIDWSDYDWTDNDNNDYSDYSDNDYNNLYGDDDNDGWDGDWDDDWDDDWGDYDYTYSSNSSKAYDENMTYDQNTKTEKAQAESGDKDNQYDEEFCSSSKMYVETPDGKHLEVSKMSGNIKLLLNDGTPMEGHVDGNIISIDKTYKSGTRFRIYVGNNQPAYVYVFGTDLTNEIYHLFPQNSRISPFLDYKNARVAFPDEDHWIEMDATPGTDYLYVLYSLVPLNIMQIENEMAKIKGNYENKIFQVMGPKTFSLKECQTSGNSTFNFQAMTVNKTTMALILKFSHAN